MHRGAKLGVVAITTLTLLAPAAVSAQDARGTPVYGSVSLREGFTPDPHEINVTPGGGIDASSIKGMSCTGNIGANPDYVVRYSGGSNLYIRSNSSDDTSLVVRSSQGQWYCDDDTNGLNPEVSIPNAAAGNYSIWVGDVSGDATSAVLQISEIAEAQVSSDDMPDMSARATYGEVILRSGFTPDPHEVEMIAGGPISASNLSSRCMGMISSSPDYEVTYRDAGSYPLSFEFVSDGDTTLVINAPDGEWYCDDDSGGNLDPRVYFRDAREGVYDIWVGSVSGNMHEGKLTISEIH